MGHEDNDGAFQCANCHEYEQERIRQAAEIERLRGLIRDVIHGNWSVTELQEAIGELK